MLSSGRFSDGGTKVKSNITSIALPDGIADIVCSNCVINLVPEAEKPAVFHEIFRILRPGGRVAISDILARQPLPENIRKDAAMQVGCISGASMPDEYRLWMADAGFRGQLDSSSEPPVSIFIPRADIVILDTKKDINVYQDPQSPIQSNSGCGCGPSKCAPATTPDLNLFVGSFQVYAVKA